jgi:hypothetical protein
MKAAACELTGNPLFTSQFRFVTVDKIKQEVDWTLKTFTDWHTRSLLETRSHPDVGLVMASGSIETSMARKSSDFLASR